jgi:hypothetical protein
MVKLKNLKKNNATIESDIIPEDSDNSGHIVVDLDQGITIDYSLPEGYEWCMNHVNHAKNKLIELAKEEHLSEQYLVMWY